MTILRIFLVILLICIIKYTKLVRFIRLICRIVDFSSLLIIEVIAKNVKIKKNSVLAEFSASPSTCAKGTQKN